MRVQNLDKNINVIFKCDVLTHKKFKEDTILKIKAVGSKIFRTHPDRSWTHPVAYMMGTGSLFQG
jgi:ribonucleotide monophosphatase NagD (HAD superfamily)